MVLWAAIAVVMIGCGDRGSQPAPPNVIIILVDTLRSDHLSPYGYDRPTSPELEKLAQRGTVFERFYAHSAVTRLSVATLFTSRYISGHGVTDQGGAALSRSIPVMSELFDASLYTRVAFITNPQVHPALGFDRGFDQFEVFFGPDLDPARLAPHDLLTPPADTVFGSVQETISDLGGEPFFAYVHLLDPHGPYTPSPQDAERFTDEAYEGPITGAIEDFVSIVRNEQRLGPDIEHFVGLYDAEIAATDRAIGAFVNWLDSQGLMANTHVLITSDHGEEFMEHGGTGHDYKIYEETVRVPLLWLGPGVPSGARIPQLAGLIDVAPTVADVIGAPTPKGSFQGRSLKPLWEGEEDVPWRRGLFLEGPARGRVERDGRSIQGVVRGVVTSDRKILARGCGVREPGWDSLEVFDLNADPKEQAALVLHESTSGPGPGLDDDLIIYEHAEAQALQVIGPHDSPRAEIPKEDLERLKALGYVQ